MLSDSVPGPDPRVRLMLGGDVMLGRLVGKAIQRFGPHYPLSGVAPLMSKADLTIVNLECAITSSTREWHGAPKAFYFGAPPAAVHALTDAGVDLVSLANNHALDYDVEGLLDTMKYLRARGIGWAGAGNSIDEARAPVFAERNGLRFGMAALCDHQVDFAAGVRRPGTTYVDLDDEPAALALMRKLLEPIQQAKADWPILSLHWGPNMVSEPSRKFRRIAHAAIDMGWRILFGHSAHVFHGIELYRGCPIVYAAGDLVDDYYIDPEFRNDHQLLFELELGRAALRRIGLHPVLIADCQARLAGGAHFGYIAKRMTGLCAEMGTRVRTDGGKLWIEP
ncbi:CapA family protein [Massilia cavernae]|uniref:CapA family protein n=1 Tax=Massilia cavernae TaxID=2320864 RepID=UPI0011C429C1|nr:CapA family protein [Massilia cavernae]